VLEAGEPFVLSMVAEEFSGCVLVLTLESEFRDELSTAVL